MIQTPKKIYEFKKGDKITRIKPSKPIMKVGDEEVVSHDYIGVPFIYVGIANGCIYLKRMVSKQEKEITSILSNMFVGTDIPEKLLNIETDIFEDGWDYYIDPNTLLCNNNDISINELEIQKKNALDKEDYKEADRLQKMIERLKS